MLRRVVNNADLRRVIKLHVQAFWDLLSADGSVAIIIIALSAYPQIHEKIVAMHPLPAWQYQMPRRASGDSTKDTQGPASR